MRILLVAHNAAPGDIDLNLARHVAMLDQARVQGCDIAVFPEFSLTGSVNPSRHAERAVAIDAEPVQAMIQATWLTGVPAVFGIAEHLDGAFHISQVYGHSGRLGGVYRKRHLGDNEQGYRIGEGAGVFQLGSARFGVTICAEGGVDFHGRRLSLAAPKWCSTARHPACTRDAATQRAGTEDTPGGSRKGSAKLSDMLGG